jgi:hypothetical protein
MLTRRPVLGAARCGARFQSAGVAPSASEHVLRFAAMAAPQRTGEQRLDALQAANETRSARAALKGKLKRGEREVADVLQHPPEYALKMKVADLLVAVPRLGRSKVKAMLSHCVIAQTKTIGALTPRQLGELLASIECARLGTDAPKRTSSRASA